MPKLKNNKDNDVEDTISDEEFIKRLKFMFKDASNIAILGHIKHMYELLHKFAKKDELIGEVRLDILDTEFIEEQFMNSLLNRRVKGESVRVEYYTKYVKGDNKDTLMANYVNEELIPAAEAMMYRYRMNELPEGNIYYVQQSEHAIKEKLNSFVDKILKQENAELPVLPNLKCSVWSEEQERVFNKSLKQLICDQMGMIKAKGAPVSWSIEIKRRFVNDVIRLHDEEGYSYQQAVEKIREEAPYLYCNESGKKLNPSTSQFHQYRRELEEK